MPTSMKSTPSSESARKNTRSPSVSDAGSEAAMSETHSQALGRRPSEVLQLVKDISGIDTQLGRQDLRTGAEREECFRLSAMLR